MKHCVVCLSSCRFLASGATHQPEILHGGISLVYSRFGAVQIQDQKEAGDPNFGLSETNLKAIISKTANRIKVSCQLGLKLSAKRAFQKCKLRGDYA